MNYYDYDDKVTDHSGKYRKPKLNPGPFDTWQCPDCGFVVSDVMWQDIAIDPECRCGKRHWSWFRFVPRIENKGEDNG